MDGKTCKRESEIAPIVLARFSMYKNQARVVEEKENEASDRETTAIEREKVAKQREEKARVREMIGWEKVTQLQICTCCVMSFFFFFAIFLCFLVG